MRTPIIVEHNLVLFTEFDGTQVSVIRGFVRVASSRYRFSVEGKKGLAIAISNILRRHFQKD